MSRSEDLIRKIGELKKTSFQEPQEAFERCQEILLEAQAEAMIDVEAHALIAMALACRSMTKLNDCFDYASDALKLFERMQSGFGIATALNLLGVVYFYYAMFEQALEHFLKALSLLEESDDYITMTRLYNNMGEVYREVNNYDEALTSYQKALDLCDLHVSALNKAVILENMGEVFYRLERYDDSFNYFQKSAVILEESHDMTALSEVNNRIGKIYLIRKEYDKARDYFNEALTRLESLGNKFFSIDVYINFAELERHFNEGLFVLYLNRAIQYGEAINARKKLSQVFQMFSEYYEFKKDFGRSLEYYKRYHHMEQLIETTVIAHKLEIIKLELNKLSKGRDFEKISQLNIQLSQNIAYQDKMLETLEKSNKRLSAQVILDELTAIPNRRGIQEWISQEWLLSHEEPFYFGMLMMDVDLFKHYNDCHGHPEGDKCLKIIAKSMVDIFEGRPGVVGRYGGEEFVCFIKASHLDEVLALAENLRKSIETLHLSYTWQSESYDITLSIGVCAGFSHGFGNIQELYALSDQQLYQAKNAGRNCVRFIEKTS